LCVAYFSKIFAEGRQMPAYFFCQKKKLLNNEKKFDTPPAFLDLLKESQATELQEKENEIRQVSTY
jgi:hypothetical protein